MSPEHAFGGVELPPGDPYVVIPITDDGGNATTFGTFQVFSDGISTVCWNADANGRSRRSAVVPVPGNNGVFSGIGAQHYVLRVVTIWRAIGAAQSVGNTPRAVRKARDADEAVIRGPRKPGPSTRFPPKLGGHIDLAVGGLIISRDPSIAF